MNKPLRNAQLDLSVIRRERKKRNPKAFDFALFDELRFEGVSKKHIIKNIFARGETSAWIAAPGGMKSALLTSAAVSVARGADWFGHRNKSGPMGVIYFATERSDLVKRRLQAHRRRDGLDNLPVAVVSEVIDMMSDQTVERAVQTIREVEAAQGVPVGLTIWDTFAKLIAAGGGDESTARDQGRVFANLQRFKNKTDAHVALIGHTGKDESRGARGSNAILGDADLMVVISGGDVRTATVTKCNNGPEGPLFSFRSEIHDFGPDEDGDPVTVNIVSSERVEAAKESGTSRWPRGLQVFRDAVDAAIIEYGIAHQVGDDGPTVRAVNVRQAHDAHKRKYVSAGDGDRSEAERKAWRRNFKLARTNNLISGEVSEGRELIWITT